MKRATKAEGERYSGVTPNHTAIRRFGSGEQADQCRLARPVDPEDPEIMPGIKGGVDIVEHDFATGSSAIGFGNAVEHDHCGS